MKISKPSGHFSLLLIAALLIAGFIIVHVGLMNLQVAEQSSSQQLLPSILQGAAFNTSLGCWLVKHDENADNLRFHVVAEANFGPGQRWEEVQKAILLTHQSNPQVHYVLVTSRLLMFELAKTSTVLASTAHDIWYCPETLYGTPIAIGNLYAGAKVVASIDNWLPPFDLQCRFSSAQGNHIAYVMQRSETIDLTGKDVGCEKYVQMGSADGLLFGNIPEQTIQFLRFPRTFWGCENVALYALHRAGVQLVNLCPGYAPVHVHKVEDRNPGRLRINHGANNVFGGQSLPLSSLCKR